MVRTRPEIDGRRVAEHLLQRHYEFERQVVDKLSYLDSVSPTIWIDAYDSGRRQPKFELRFSSRLLCNPSELGSWPRKLWYLDDGSPQITYFFRKDTNRKMLEELWNEYERVIEDLTGVAGQQNLKIKIRIERDNLMRELTGNVSEKPLFTFIPDYDQFLIEEQE